ncbi:MAG: hypothetical protein U0990_11060 [Candidatus Nanopelagicales bacterium]|nr:hypothetical protein [Candidatus Nanopelagicales bacterium]MDZ4250606.1 hypothetical protein [Candidatus Nanopelagicales bacterium]
MAATRKVCEVPFDKPVTTRDLAVEPVLLTTVDQEPDPALRWIRYPVTALPPIDAGAVQDTLALPSPATPRTDLAGPVLTARLAEDDAVTVG